MRSTDAVPSSPVPVVPTSRLGRVRVPTLQRFSHHLPVSHRSGVRGQDRVGFTSETMLYMVPTARAVILGLCLVWATASVAGASEAGSAGSVSQSTAANTCTSGTTTQHGKEGMELLTRLLSSCDIPPFGNQPYDTGWSAAQGTTPLSVTCPIADLAKAPSNGFASTIFSPDSTVLRNCLSRSSLLKAPGGNSQPWSRR